MLLSLVTVISVFQLAIATNLNPPILYSRHAAQEGSLQKRETCEDGSRCLLGSCCGDGCALNCCALDNGGLGCGITERCQFRGNVFVGCCGNLLGGCTGEATHVTVHTPYSTVTLGAPTDARTTPAETTSSTSHRSAATTAAFSPNNNGASAMGVEAPVLAGMVALGAVLL
ncbi:hypothetical protein KXW18_002370 [Aspergillus fumigatus]|nr:hypothetical protein KXX42_002385 [Aspergillus fumigatus]KAH2660569.1 hypothetical protein KXV32_001040 [Aspergillus fumigatus]KAH3022314.1 hypothetical protein KXW60_004127 [Aspergillus fumigatus]KAH3141106.1 hypothetical protein KXW18_002370 [Aspergillus fumigatus]KAH3524100.1 hypothetical protein KXV64_005154 [Aspergillus fumigatus]